MAIRTYIAIMTLNVNGLNAPTKTQRLAKWIQKQDAVYKRPTSDLGTHTDWEWEDGKRYSTQVVIKRNWEQHTYIKVDFKIRLLQKTKNDTA